MKQQGANLYTLELYKNIPELGDCKEVKTLKINHVMWHKENAFNYLIKHIPSDTKVVCWVDSDVIFADDNWQDEVYNMIVNKGVNMVQLFKHCKLLSFKATNKIHNCYDWRTDINELFHCRGTSKRYSNRKWGYTRRSWFLDGAPGYAWAINFDILKTMDGFYDKCILGGGDMIFVHSINNGCNFYSKHKGYKNSVTTYKTKLNKLLDGKYGHLDGSIYHLYHGSYENRQHCSRYDIIKNIDFIPENNLVARKDGIYEWNNIDKKELQNIEAKINHYFTVRNCLNVSIYPQDLLISDKHDIEPLEYPFKTKVRDKTEVILIRNITFSEILDQLEDNYYYLLLDYRIMATNDQIESITNPTLNPINDLKKTHELVTYYDEDATILKLYLKDLFLNNPCSP